MRSKNDKKIIIFTLIVVLLICLTGGTLLILESFDKKESPKETLYFEHTSTNKEVGRLNTIEKLDNKIYYHIEYPSIGYDAIDKDINNIIDTNINNIKLAYNDKEINYYYFIEYETYLNDNILNILIKETLENANLESIIDKTNIYHYDINKQELLTKDDIFKNDYLDELKKYQEDINENFNFIINNNNLVLTDSNTSIPLNEIASYLNIELKEDNTSSDNEETKYDIVNKEYQLSENSNVYKENNIDSEVLNSLNKDDKVKVYKKNEQWSIIFFNDQIAYLETSKLTDIKVEEPPQEEVNQGEDSQNIPPDKETKPITVYASTNVNIRSAPNTKSTILGELKTGESITKIGTNGSYTVVKYQNTKAYISSSCLTDVKIEPKEIKLNVPPQGDIDPNKPMVALTFDDGPNNTSTVRILDTLEKYNAHATFFDLGNLMLRYPDVVKREAAIGEVGTHTYSHKNLNKLNKEQLIAELNKSKEAYKQVLGTYPVLMRPPYGNANNLVKATINDMVIINWDVDSLDWKYRNKDKTLYEIDKYGDLNGKIILMHSIHKETADAVEILIPDLIDRGYQIVTVSQLATYKGYTLKTGTIYYNFK